MIVQAEGAGREAETEVVTETEIEKTSNASRAEAEAISRLTVPGETPREPGEAEVEAETTAILEVETAMMIRPEGASQASMLRLKAQKDTEAQIEAT